MKLLSLKTTAFGPLGGRVFELRGESAVIYGPNEAGKTSFIDAACAALYGPPKGNSEEARVFKTRYGGGSASARLAAQDGSVTETPAKTPEPAGLPAALFRTLLVVRSGEVPVQSDTKGFMQLFAARVLRSGETDVRQAVKELKKIYDTRSTGIWQKLETALLTQAAQLRAKLDNAQALESALGPKREKLVSAEAGIAALKTKRAEAARGLELAKLGALKTLRAELSAVSREAESLKYLTPQVLIKQEGQNARLESLEAERGRAAAVLKEIDASAQSAGGIAVKPPALKTAAIALAAAAAAALAIHFARFSALAAAFCAVAAAAAVYLSAFYFSKTAAATAQRLAETLAARRREEAQKLESLEKSISGNTSAINSELRKLGVPSLAALRDGAARHNQLLNTKERLLAEITRETGCAAGNEAAALESAVLDLESKSKAYALPAAQNTAEIQAHIARLDAAIEKAQSELKAAQSGLDAALNESARAEGALCEPKAAAFIRLQKTERRLKEIALWRKAAETAAAELERIATGQENEINQAVDAASPVFSALTAGRYSGLALSGQSPFEAGGLCAIHPQLGRNPAEWLSSGARDLAWLSLRAAFAKTAFQAPALMILDEPFLALDPARAKRAAQSLKAALAGWQIIVLTKEPDCAAELQAQGFARIDL